MKMVCFPKGHPLHGYGYDFSTKRVHTFRFGRNRMLAYRTTHKLNNRLYTLKQIHDYAIKHQHTMLDKGSKSQSKATNMVNTMIGAIGTSPVIPKKQSFIDEKGRATCDAVMIYDISDGRSDFDSIVEGDHVFTRLADADVTFATVVTVESTPAMYKITAEIDVVQVM